jgi:hypothetical protein
MASFWDWTGRFSFFRTARRWLPRILFFRALCPCVTESLEVTMTSPLPLIFRVVRCTLVASCDGCLDQLD